MGIRLTITHLGIDAQIAVVPGLNSKAVANLHAAHELGELAEPDRCRHVLRLA